VSPILYLQSQLVERDLFPKLAPRHRGEQLSEPVPDEIDLEADARPTSVHR